MSDTMAPEDQPLTKTGANVDYLLKELEFQVAIETKARDRMENTNEFITNPDWRALPDYDL
jgi:hypothetical protein